MKDSFETRATRRHEHSLSLEVVSRKRKWFLPGDYRAGLLWAEVFSATDPMLVTVTALHRSIVGCQEKALISSAKCHLVTFSIFDGCFSVLWGWRMHDVTLCGSSLHGDHCSSQICFFAGLYLQAVEANMLKMICHLVLILIRPKHLNWLFFSKSKYYLICWIILTALNQTIFKGQIRGAFPEQWRKSLINHRSTMHCFGNELASHDCFPNTVASPSFEPHWFSNIGPLLMMSHACGGGITYAI